MVRKTLMALLLASGVAVVPAALAEGTYGGGSDTGSGTGAGSTTGSGSTMEGGTGTGTGTGSGMGGSTGTDSTGSGMSGSSMAAEAYRRECITDTQKRTQRCMDLQKSMEGATGTDSGPTSSGSGDTSSGMGSGSSTTSPTVP